MNRPLEIPRKPGEDFRGFERPEPRGDTSAFALPLVFSRQLPPGRDVGGSARQRDVRPIHAWEGVAAATGFEVVMYHRFAAATEPTARLTGTVHYFATGMALTELLTVRSNETERDCSRKGPLGVPRPRVHTLPHPGSSVTRRFDCPISAWTILVKVDTVAEPRFHPDREGGGRCCGGGNAPLHDTSNGAVDRVANCLEVSNDVGLPKCVTPSGPGRR